LVAEGVTNPKAIRAAEVYDERLASIGKLQRLEPYRDNKTPILHRCLEHGEEHPCSPSNGLQGGGLRCCSLATRRAVGDRKQAAAAARYDDKLAKLGKLQRLEPYRGSGAPILHRCLKHGEEHPCSPSDGLAGKGVRCCRLAGCRAVGDRLQAAAAARYDAKLAELGRLVRLEPYRDNKTPILHRCLEHGEEHPCSPAPALKGHGLRCCKLAAARAAGGRYKTAAAATYDGKLAATGRMVRLEPYRGNRIAILHRCLEHGEEHLVMPANVLSGQGLRCCGLAVFRAQADRAKADAAARYDDKLAKLGKLQRLEPYRGNKVAILHRCLEHGEEHPCGPSHALGGQGLRCCRLAAANFPRTFPSLIWCDHPPELQEPCELYVYTVPGRPGLVKPGISYDHTTRAGHAHSRALYGEVLAVWELPTRVAALLAEAAILRDPAIPRPADLAELEGLGGAGEVREVDAEALVAHAQALVDSLADHVGPWQAWALDNVPTIYRAERIALRRQLAAVPEVP
jgi:hypothetical protein